MGVSACTGRIYSYTANTVKVPPFGVVYLCMFGGYSIINGHCEDDYEIREPTQQDSGDEDVTGMFEGSSDSDNDSEE